MLIVAAGLLARSFFNTLRRPLGFDTSKPVLTLFVIDKGPGNRVYAGVEEMAARLRALPGVTRAAYCRRTAFSGSGDGATRDVSIPSRVAALGMELLRLRYNQVSVDFLAVSGTRLLAGRGFTPADMDSGARVVLVNQTMANRFWPDRSPIGHSILVDQHATTVVGVVEDTVISQVHEAPEPFMVLPFGQMPTGELTFLLETAGPPEAVLGPARRELSQSGSLVLVQATTLAQQFRDALYEDRMPALLCAIMGLLGIVLASAGLFGVVLHRVNRAARETAVRMALGARVGTIMGSV